MGKVASWIKDVTEYGKFISFCIEHDINVFRTYWDDRATDICYFINWQEKRCYYCNRAYWLDKGFTVKEPKFSLEYGQYRIVK